MSKLFFITLLVSFVGTSFSQISSSDKNPQQQPFTWPAIGEVVEVFDSVNKGIELEGQIGNSITAAADGKVVYAGDGLRGYEKLVIVKHDNDLLTAYSRNRLLLVKENMLVKQGQPIAEMGQVNGVGRLHFEIRYKGKPTNPLEYLPKQEKKLSNASKLIVNQLLWQQFNVSDRNTILNRFSNLELVAPETIGVIHAVQSINRSTAGTNTGAILGGALGQAAYIDNAFKGTGNNYSAVNQVGAAVLGAAIGSAADQTPQSHFIFNYAIKTLDGQLREVRTSSNQEFTKPIGQCVSFPEMRPLQAISCSTDKVQLLKSLSSLSSGVEAKLPTKATEVKVTCRISGIGLMTLERNVCTEMEGKEE